MGKGGKKELSAEDREKIAQLFASGVPIRKAARIMGVDRTTIRRWGKRWRDESTVETRPRSGRPRCTTVDQDKLIVTMMENGDFPAASVITSQLGLRCCVEVVRNRLHEAGYRNWHKEVPSVQNNQQPKNNECLECKVWNPNYVANTYQDDTTCSNTGCDPSTSHCDNAIYNIDEFQIDDLIACIQNFEQDIPIS